MKRLTVEEFKALNLGAPEPKKPRRKQRTFQERDTRRVKRACAECDRLFHAITLALEANTAHHEAHRREKR